MPVNNATSFCKSCGEPIVNRPNPTGPEVWCDLDGGSYGCLQRAFDEFEGERTTDEQGNPTFEPDAPYPPHLPLIDA